MSDLTSTATDDSSSTSEYVLAVAPEALEQVLGIVVEAHHMQVQVQVQVEAQA